MYRVYKRKDIQYYSLYIAISMLYIGGLLCSSSFLNQNIFESTIFKLVDKPATILMFWLYIKFAKNYLDIPMRNPEFDKKLIVVEKYLLIIFSSLFVLAPFVPNLYYEIFFVLVSLIPLILSLTILKEFSRNGLESLNAYVFIGASILILNAFSSIIIVNIQNFLGLISDYDTVLHRHTFFVLELIVFSIGLIYKSFQNELENQKLNSMVVREWINKNKLIEEMTSIKEEFARDVHDNLASSLTAIEMLAQMNISGKHGDQNQAILKVSQDMLESLNDSNWLLRGKQKSISELIEKVETYVRPILNARKINFEIQINEKTDQLNLSVFHQKHLIYIFKEMISNSLKHSGCENIFLNISFDEKTLCIHFRDDGRKKQENNNRNGFGIDNIRSRVHTMNGQIKINLSENKSVEFDITIPVL